MTIVNGEPASRDAVALGKPTRPSWHRAARSSGFFPPVGRETALRTSFCQLCQLTALSTCVLLALVGLVVITVTDEANVGDLSTFGAAAALFVMRALSIFSGASPAITILLCALLIHVWAVGRMARLRLAHGVSRLAPEASMSALVSTPVAFILHPPCVASSGSARAVQSAERAVINAIVRPITGPYYASALAILLLLLGLVFSLKPLSTLEHSEGTILLGTGLALSALVIGNTLIQLVQYWVSLERLLKLVLVHRLGRAFGRVAAFVRDSAAARVSRAPHDLLRLSSCATCLNDLVRQTKRVVGDPEGIVSPDLGERLEQHRRQAVAARDRALVAADGSNPSEAAEEEASLGRELVEACRVLVEVLTPCWDGTEDEPSQWSRSPAWRFGKSDLAPASSALRAGEDGATEGALEPPAQLLWLREAESLVATVTALILNRHVRPFQYFVYTLTGCTLLLLLAVSTYAFEPHRLLLTCIWVMVGASVALGLWVYVQMDKNGLLSRISGTTPGQLTWDGALVVRVVTWVVLPLLSVAAVQYPDLANRVFAFLEPLTRALQ